ncbi:hypothetical protein GCM10028799_57490 [Kribbella italica]
MFFWVAKGFVTVVVLLSVKGCEGMRQGRWHTNTPALKMSARERSLNPRQRELH